MYSLFFGELVVFVGLIISGFVYVFSIKNDSDGVDNTFGTGMIYTGFIAGAVVVVSLCVNFYNELYYTSFWINFRRQEYEKTTKLPPIEKNWNSWFLNLFRSSGFYVADTTNTATYTMSYTMATIV